MTPVVSLAQFAAMGAWVRAGLVCAFISFRAQAAPTPDSPRVETTVEPTPPVEGSSPAEPPPEAPAAPPETVQDDVPAPASSQDATMSAPPPRGAEPPTPGSGPRSMDSGSEFTEEETTPAPLSDCAVARAADGPEACSTLREGTLSGGYLGIDAGYATLAADAARRVGAGPGAGFHLRLGFAFWDHAVVGIGLSGLLLEDEQPFSQQVVDCTTVDNTVVSCSDQPHAQSSSLGATLFTTELGVQHRFRPSRATSIVPGLMAGYQMPFSDLERSVACEGCRSVPLAATARGIYLCPFFRVTFGKGGELAAVIRSSWYLTGDLNQVTTLGGEVGMP